MDKFKQLEDSMLIGPQPTEEYLQQARLQGIKTIIDFKMPGEVSIPNADLVARNGLNDANIPLRKVNLSPNQIDELNRVMQEKEGPFLAHCASGAQAAMLLALRKAKKHNRDTWRTFKEA